MKQREEVPKNVPQKCMGCIYHPINTQVAEETGDVKKQATDNLYPVQQEIRKTLQSMLYHGYGIISAELDILELFKSKSDKV